MLIAERECRERLTIEEKFPKLSHQNINSFMKLAYLFLLSLMVTSQIISANRNKIESNPLSDASLADSYFKSMKTGKGSWKVKFLQKSILKSEL